MSLEQFQLHDDVLRTFCFQRPNDDDVQGVDVLPRLWGWSVSVEEGTESFLRSSLTQNLNTYPTQTHIIYKYIIMYRPNVYKSISL